MDLPVDHKDLVLTRKEAVKFSEGDEAPSGDAGKPLRGLDALSNMYQAPANLVTHFVVHFGAQVIELIQFRQSGWKRGIPVGAQKMPHSWQESGSAWPSSELVVYWMRERWCDEHRRFIRAGAGKWVEAGPGHSMRFHPERKYMNTLTRWDPFKKI